MGLDLGTDSVGWCVTDENGKIIKKNGKSLWGYHGFNEATDASGRRANREQRRRYNRRQERIALLRSIFNDEISKIDSSFFYRLDNSFYHNEDREKPFDYTLFNSLTYTDTQYYEDYPTIYHLRNHLIHSNKKEDIRFIYLALHHMIKYRGNFLNNMEEFHALDKDEINDYFNELNDNIQNLIDDESSELVLEQLNFNSETFEKLKIINEECLGITLLKEKFGEVLNSSNNKYTKNVFIPLMVGGNIKVDKLGLLNIDGKEKDDVCVKKDNFDQLMSDLCADNPTQESLISCFINCKKIYEFFLIGRLLGKHKYLSEAMVERYNEHKKQLLELKDYVRKNAKEKYDDIFRVNDPKKNNYVAYIGSNLVDGKKETRKHTTTVEFYSYLKKTLEIEKYNGNDEYLLRILKLMENEEFLLRQNSSNNTVFPYQLNKLEMKIILDNQSKYYPFLKEAKDGYTNIQKIISILEYKIPYYVGPLISPIKDNERSKFSWISRKNDKIYPWNFDKVVNLDQTAKNFIERMLNKCTYLPSCYCLAKNSLLFSYFNVLNNLNKTYVNGRALKEEEKQGIINNLFKNKRKVTKKDIVSYFYEKTNETVVLSTSNQKELKELDYDMSSYVDFKNILGEEFVNENIELIENIIRDIVIFEDKSILEKRLKSEYNIVNEKVIKRIKGLNYAKYASISKELLTDIKYIEKDDETGEVFAQESIISIMEKTNQNLQEVLYDEKYNFMSLIREYNEKHGCSTEYKTIEEYVDDLSMVSPGMKRPMIQAYKIIEEVEKILGQRIDEFYVECTKTNKAKKKEKLSRKDYLLNLYTEAIKTATFETQSRLKEFREQIKNLNKDIFRSDKYYLYFLQLGKCMYTGHPIDFSQLNDDAHYNIDHIYPQSLIKDDSITNRVLVETRANEAKKDFYPIPKQILWNGNYHAASGFFDELKKMKLINSEKHRRLTATELTETDMESFVNRQLVYTNQAVKGLVNAILTMKSTKDFTPKVVYSKGENVSDFRKKYDIVKSRNVNNFHHAHDAYLNIIVGRTIDVYFSQFQMKYGRTEYLKWMHDHGYTTNVMHIFDQTKDRTKQDIYSGKGLVWSYQDNKSLKEVKENIYNRFDIFSTERTYKANDFFGKITIYPAGEGGNIPVKTKGPLADVNKYGGFKQYTFGFYSLIKVGENYILEAIPTLFRNNIDAYLNNQYSSFEIIIKCLNTNTIIVSDKKKYVITGRTGDSYVIKNKNERIFNSKQIHIIKKIEKLNELISKVKVTGKETLQDITKQGFTCDGDDLIISPAKNEKNKTICINEEEYGYIYDSLIEIYSKDIYSYSTSISLVNKLSDKKDIFNKLSFFGKNLLIMNLLDFLKCNMRGTIDLSLLGESKNSCQMTISKKLKNCKIIFESITGYYSKTVIEIK